MDNQMKMDLLIISIHANAKALIAMGEALLEQHPDLPEEVRVSMTISHEVMNTLMMMNEDMHNDIQSSINSVNELRDILKK